MAEAQPAAAPAATTPPPPAAAPAATPAAQPGEGSAPPAAAPAAPAEPAKTPWFQARIDAVTREKWEEKRRADVAEARIRELEAARTAPAPAQAPAAPAAPPVAAAPIPAAGMVPQAEVERLANERAGMLASQADFNARCNTIYNQGIKDIPEFKTAVDNFQMFGGLAQHQAFLNAVTLLPEGNGAQVLAHLGTNLDEANRILTIRDPIAQALEVSKVSATLKKGPGVSQAPAPVQPGVGGAPAVQPGPNADGKFNNHADYVEWRKKNFK